MRELILKMSMSLDGFVGSPEGEAEWVFGADQEAIAWSVETVWNASLHIMGSRSFHDMAAYWPTSTLVFAPPMNQIPKAVFSKQGRAVLKAAAMTKGLRQALDRAGDTQTGQLQPGGESWGEAYVATGDLADEVARLKAGDGKPIIAHGGAAFARSLIAQNLVDEYALVVHPIALGKGLPIFAGLPAPRPLKLVSSKAFPGGAVAQIYRPV
ncbi:dihydrofolate reductase family protein [Phyllobacterium myrsinacearum]|uniref:Dihydrofolate reductase n=1 Tax=Phyllobacterium myrsinacearum TaxID=28101 RepID=A0A839EJ39_9HYPH|nr:dihydrofolate reductase family protein [Phyllobacterium myrsinacearum]MBA8876517.1 dihydrofolate reductase [Phyllobacterium myrsinacearum]